MKKLILIVLLCSQIKAQISIHELESRTHRFDILKIDSSVSELVKGKKLAIEGKLELAEKEFKKAICKNKSYAYFDLGVLYIYMNKPEKALHYLKLSYEIEPDTLCLEQIKNVERIINERRKFMRKKR